MNWPAPTALAPPSPSGPPPPSDDEAEHERPDRRLGAVPAAAWVALLGSALVLTAAVAVVASNWDTVGQGLRVGGLTLVTGGALLAAVRLRPVTPTTAGIIAHAGTFLTASVAIAMLSWLGATWPLCLTAGGAVLVASTEYQSRQWRRATMHLGQLAGYAMAATGFAALANTSAGLIAAITSVALLVVGARRRSVAMAVLAVLSPALTALAEAGVGAGTLARAGLVGERLSWSGPVVGVLAATVIGAIAMQRRSNPLMLVAAASPVIGVVTGLAAVDGSAVAWWSVPALALIASELGLWLLPDERFRNQIGDLVTTGAGVLAGLTWAAPALVTVELFTDDLSSPWAIPVAFTTLAVALSTRRWMTTDSVMADLGLAAVAAGVLGVLSALDTPTTVLAASAIGLTMGVAILSRRLSALAIDATAVWALLSVVWMHAELDGARSSAVSIVAIGALLGIVLAARARLAAVRGVAGWIEMAAIATAATLGVLAVTTSNGPAVGLGTMATVTMLAVLIERRLTVWAVAVTGTTAVVGLDAALADGTFATTYVYGWCAVTASFVMLWTVRRSPLAGSVAAAAATITVATMAPVLGIGPVDFTVMAMITASALTGLTYSWGRRSPLDASSATAGGVLIGTTMLDIDPAWHSAAWVIVGLQIVVLGSVLERRVIQSAGFVVTFGGLLSGWFTSGLHDWFMDVVEPADVTVGDLWMAATAIAALVAGATLRSTLRVNSWIAYSATLVISGIWLSVVHVDRHTVWAIPLLLSIGVVSSGMGAWYRLAAPLVGGTALTALAVFFASSSDLTAIPTWVWLAAGGGLLIGVAVLIERTGKPGAPDLRELIARWQ